MYPNYGSPINGNMSSNGRRLFEFSVLSYCCIEELFSCIENSYLLIHFEFYYSVVSIFDLKFALQIKCNKNITVNVTDNCLYLITIKSVLYFVLRYPFHVFHIT